MLTWCLVSVHVIINIDQDRVRRVVYIINIATGPTPAHSFVRWGGNTVTTGGNRTLPTDG